MGKLQTININPATGVPQNTAIRLTQDFLDRHASGLDDLLRRFPGLHGPSFRRAIEACFAPSETAPELAMALEEAVDTLLSLQGEDCHPLPVDSGRRLYVDAGIRWYAARLYDLSRAARTT
ncbi:hypothetical protein [Roseovarius sp. M141]|uniref:hypothetical protein n=1 Tax=Roseovarius sp. M141 TaxID=2583806 RepID=UPI0020CBA64C|nr:hypothetical protein [Roseovarius sp. M141]MCQ0091626.1 hypothetical protein [Roseovarius sp. M141]